MVVDADYLSWVDFHLYIADKKAVAWKKKSYGPKPLGGSGGG